MCSFCYLHEISWVFSRDILNAPSPILVIRGHGLSRPGRVVAYFKGSLKLFFCPTGNPLLRQGCFECLVSGIWTTRSSQQRRYSESTEHEGGEQSVIGKGICALFPTHVSSHNLRNTPTHLSINVNAAKPGLHLCVVVGVHWQSIPDWKLHNASMDKQFYRHLKTEVQLQTSDHRNRLLNNFLLLNRKMHQQWFWSREKWPNRMIIWEHEGGASEAHKFPSCKAGQYNYQGRF